jgi:hypothetical protein
VAVARLWSGFAVCTLVLAASAAGDTGTGPFARVGGELVGGPGFGRSMALSANGTTALFGDVASGRAIVYVRKGSGWRLQARLTGTGAPGAIGFGAGVALSADGDTALVSGNFRNSFSTASWVFTRSGSTWRQQAVLPTGRARRQQGDSFIGFGGEPAWNVALSADGTTALVASAQTSRAKTVWVAWVFSHVGATWTRQARLSGMPRAGGGATVALSADGSTALIAENGERPSVYVRSGSTWTKQATLATANPSGLCFAECLALSADGRTALVAGETTRIFTRRGSTWTRQPSTLPGGGVALSGDGTRAVVGSALRYAGIGAAFVISHDGTSWTAQRFTPGGIALAYDAHVAISGDGHTVLVGGDPAGIVWTLAER